MGIQLRCRQSPHYALHRGVPSGLPQEGEEARAVLRVSLLDVHLEVQKLMAVFLTPIAVVIQEQSIIPWCTP